MTDKEFNLRIEEMNKTSIQLVNYMESRGHNFAEMLMIMTVTIEAIEMKLPELKELKKLTLETIHSQEN